jgi:hypothetical protein
MKMPMPMMVPTTIIIASKRDSVRFSSWSAPSSCITCSGRFGADDTRGEG